MAFQDEGSNYVRKALMPLKRLGATEPVLPDYKGSFALVGYAGENKPSWVEEKIAKRGLGPSEISLKIQLTNPVPQPHPAITFFLDYGIDLFFSIICVVGFFLLFLFFYSRGYGVQLGVNLKPCLSKLNRGKVLLHYTQP